MAADTKSNSIHGLWHVQRLSREALIAQTLLRIIVWAWEPREESARTVRVRESFGRSQRVLI